MSIWMTLQRNQSMIFSIIIIVHTVDSLNQLDTDTESLISVDKEHLCDVPGICYQQEDELNSALPYGLRRLKPFHTLTTESCAVAIPNAGYTPPAEYPVTLV